mgnify:CR=1 FL=1
MKTKLKQPKDIIDIPMISNFDTFEANKDKASENGFDHCPCCGRAIKNHKFFFNSIYGSNAYKASDKTEYNDAWIMGVGSECYKKFPEGYIFTIVKQ